MSPSIAKLVAGVTSEDASTGTSPRRGRRGGSPFLRELSRMGDVVSEALRGVQRAGQREVADLVAVATRDFQRELLDLSQPQIPLPTIPIPSWEAILSQAIQEALEAVNPLARDIRIVRDPTASEEEQVAALERLAEGVPWPPSKHAARGNAARVRAAFAAYVANVRQARLLADDTAHVEQAFADARRDLLGQAILEVLANFDHPQRFRIGRWQGSYFVQDVPARLPLADGWFHRWFHAQVISTAEDDLLSDLQLDDAKHLRTIPLATQPEIADPAHDDLLGSLATPWDELDDSKLQQLLCALTPAERAIWQLMWYGYDDKELAEYLDKAGSTIRNQRRSVLNKARQALA